MKYIPRTAVLSALILFFGIIFLFLSYTKLRRDSVPPFSKTDLEETDLDKIRQQVEQINPFFIKNKGQAPEDILYYFQGNNGAVYFTKEKIVFQNKYPIASEESSTTTLLVREVVHQMRFEGQQDDVMISAEDKQEATLNYFVSGVDVTDIPTYGKIIFRNIYPHIDAVFFFADNKLKYDIVIHPNGNPEDIQLAFEGIDELTVDHTGKLLLKTDAETVVHEAPHTYQQDGGSNISVSASYVVNRDNTVSINFGQYDLSRDVIIDPTFSSLAASTFLGGSSSDVLNGLVSDVTGNIYITGYTWSFIFPTTTEAYDEVFNGVTDVFVSKFSSDLATLSASTFIGGADTDQAGAIALDSSGNVYITGYTVSTNFPTSTGVYGQSNSGGDEVFVAKLNSSLSSLSAATYLGNSGNERASSLALSADESSVYVTGYTWSGSFPTIGAYDNSLAGLQDVFVSKLSADLTTLSASTFVGGSDADQANALVLDSADNVYITGYTVSTNFPTSTGVYGQSNSGGDEVFVAKLNSSLGTLLGSSYLGGSSNERADAICIYNKNMYVGGYTRGADFPAVSYDPIHNGSDDIFLSKLNSNSTPTAILGFPSQTTFSTVTVTTTITDADADITSLTIEHSTNGTSWTSSTISDVVADYGASIPGTGSITGIDTDSAGTNPDYAVNLTISWNIEADLPNTEDAGVFLRFVPNDGLENGTLQTSSAFLIDTKAPSVPGDLVLNTVSPASISFVYPSVTSTDANFQEYKIYYDTVAIVSVTDSAFTSSTDPALGDDDFNEEDISVAFSGLTPNTVYYFNLFTYDAWGHVVSSTTEISTTTLSAVPNVLTASDVSGEAATISWAQNGNPNGTEYRIEHISNTAMTSGWTSATAYTFSSLNCGTDYTFHVTSRNSVGSVSAWSSNMTVTTNACGAVPIPVVPPAPPAEPLQQPPVESEEEEPEEECAPSDPLCSEEILQPTGLITIVGDNGEPVSFTKIPDVTIKFDVSYADQVALTLSSDMLAPNFGDASFMPIVSQLPFFLEGQDGKKCIHARFRNTSEQFTYDTYACAYLDTIAPAVPVFLKSSFEPDPNGNGMNVTFLGTAEPGVTVFLSQPTIQVSSVSEGAFYGFPRLWVAALEGYTTTASLSGTWSLSIPVVFSPGAYTFTLQAADVAGNKSAIASYTVNVSEQTEEEQPEKSKEEPQQILEEESLQEPENKPLSEPANGEQAGSNFSSDIPLPTGEQGVFPISSSNNSIDTEEDTDKKTLKQSASSLLLLPPSVAKTMSAIGKKVAPVVEDIINDPRVESANQIYVAPAVAVASAANVAAGFGMAQVLSYMRYLFTQPFTLLRLRKRRKTGVVYHAFTKRPIDLAVVRLINKKTGAIQESRVTDMEGRYLFIVPKGKYSIAVTKSGFQGFSEHLHSADEDSSYTDLYHGETITALDDGRVIAYNIPLDPGDMVRSTSEILKDHSQKIVRYAISSLGIFLAFLSFLISPNLFIFFLLCLHILFFSLFRRLARVKIGNQYGVILDSEKKEPLDKVVVRIFDAVYNKLVDTKVTDRKGRYASLVGPSKYYVTYERLTHHKKQTDVIDYTPQSRGGIIARNERLEPKNTVSLSA
ncbi:MAG: hypothetical protein A3C10_03875 [Candidatus Magasanikbacteria bacterium RIFCSPHIGHO2_02_FULL_48_18]|nr:MAG: hypothetical protein A3C10_03875 [Candidatus Magasanikbacteria bacterium RIFCSPHIGHO2_02_FULL_48_18]